jgi:predicted DNA-binding transcriptional regulator YafY
VYHPTTRVLAALELLQVHRQLSGAELAARLEVDRRTVRRYITMLQDLGIPIDAEQGRHGGYRLRPNFKLPPLMFTEDEALGLALGLLAARRIGFAADPIAIEAALAKIERVLPPNLREHLLALQATIALDFRESEVPPMGALVAALGAAARLGRRVRLRYRSRDRDETERLLDPYGVVYHAAIWYVVGHCHLRDDIRVFRLDRVLAAEWCDDAATFAPPPDFDSLDHVTRSLAATPRTYSVAVTLYTSPETVRRYLPASLVTLEPTPDGTLLRCTTDSPRWIAAILAGLNCDFTIHEPDELRTALRELAARLTMLAEESPPA